MPAPRWVHIGTEIRGVTRPVHSEDPRAVHYVKPCKSVRETGGLNFLYSQYYLGVNCDACLENRPPGRLRRRRFHPAVETAIAASVPLLVLPGAVLGIFLTFKDGEIVPGLCFLSLLTMVAHYLLWKQFDSLIRPLASRIMARPFNRSRH